MKTSKAITRSSDYPMPHWLLSVCVCFFLIACAISEAAAATSQPLSPVAEAIASGERFRGDAFQDAWRKPDAVLAFMGVKPGMHVLDYFAGAGYYSELLARSVGPAGSVIAYNNEPFVQGAAGATLARRLENHRLGNAQVLTVPTDQLKLEPDSLDGVLFVMSYHDLYSTPKQATRPMGNPTQVNADLFRALKPGGVIVVVDHAANPGSDPAQAAQTLHRIDPQAVKDDFAKAGFVFDGESAVLQHPEDDHTQRVFDPAIRFRTDQFILRFRKPAQK